MSESINAVAALVGRLMMSAIFLMSGYGKVVAYATTAAYMEKNGLPGQLLPITILVELGGGILLAIGYQTRLVAIILAGFTLVAASIFHSNFGDRNQLIHFMKNVAIAGGFLLVFANGGGAWSVDGRSRS